MPLLLIITSGVLLGLSYLSGKRLAMENYSSSTMVLSYSLIGMVTALPLLLYEFGIPTDTYHWSLSIISPVLFGLSAFFSYKAYKLVDASVVGLVSRVNIVVSAILGMIFFSEVLQGYSLLGLVLVLIGSMLVIYEGKRIRLEKGVGYALLMGAIYGLLVVIDKVVIEQFSPFTYVVFNNLVVVIMFSFIAEARANLLKLWKQQPVWSLITSITGLGSWITFLVALQSGSVSVLYPVWESIALVVTVLLSVWYFKESDQLWQKFLGAAVTVVGIILMS